jgi:hypothetical protein
MSWLSSWLSVPEERLEPGERIHWAIPANRSVSWRAVGGRLSATDRRLIFRPHRFDRKTGAGVFEAPLSAIEAVGIQPRTWGPFNGGLVRRLRLRLAGGETECFVVSGLEEVIARLEALLRERR